MSCGPLPIFCPILGAVSLGVFALYSQQTGVEAACEQMCFLPMAVARPTPKTKTRPNIAGRFGNTWQYRYLCHYPFMLLDLSASTQSLLTGAGVIGLAVGFGSQALVRDFMSGILVLYEGQYSVGDKVKIGGFEGTVKKLRCVPRCWKARMGSRFIFPTVPSITWSISHKMLRTSLDMLDYHLAPCRKGSHLGDILIDCPF